MQQTVTGIVFVRPINFFILWDKTRIKPILIKMAQLPIISSLLDDVHVALKIAELYTRITFKQLQPGEVLHAYTTGIDRSATAVMKLMVNWKYSLSIESSHL